jgi:hypothetical protein
MCLSMLYIVFKKYLLGPKNAYNFKVDTISQLSKVLIPDEK